MRAFEIGVMVPVAIKEPGENHCLDFGVGPLVVFGFVAGVGIAFGIDLGSEEDLLAVGEPHGAVCFGGYASNFLWLADHCPASRIKVADPDLGAAVAGADK